MRNSAHPPLPDRPARAGLAGKLWRLVLALELALQVRRERRMLLGLDDRALKDIGCNRGQVYAEAHRPFWDIPGDRLCPRGAAPTGRRGA